MLPFVDQVARLISADVTVSIAVFFAKLAKAIVYVPGSTHLIIDGPLSELVISSAMLSYSH
jgi:hypothetical protein